VRKNYAEESAELVSQMYFQKRNRDRAPAADGGTAPATPAEASQSAPAVTLQAAPSQHSQLEVPASPAETASQETPASPSATQQETLVSETQQETLAAPPTETLDKWAEKPDSDSAWGAGTSDDKWT
jgi:hypothetical protein